MYNEDTNITICNQCREEAEYTVDGICEYCLEEQEFNYTQQKNRNIEIRNAIRQERKQRKK